MWTFYYFVREVFSNLRSNPLISLAAVTTVLVLVLVLGIFGVVTLNLEHMSASLLKDLRVVVYLKDEVPSAKIAAVRSKLTTIPHVTESNVVDKDVALQRLMARLNGRFELNDINKNPLPDSVELKVDEPRAMPEVAHQAELLPEVQKVKYGEQVAQRLLALTRVLRWTGGGLLTVLLLSTVLVISNTIRLAVFSRRREIEIMQMVGAARWFIQIPFVFEGIFLGFIGAATAAFLVSSSYRILLPQLLETVSFIPLLSPAEILPQLVPLLVAIGVGVGAFGSYLAVNRYLKV
jgi:cell division transport system permease protein